LLVGTGSRGHPGRGSLVRVFAPFTQVFELATGQQDSTDRSHAMAMTTRLLRNVCRRMVQVNSAGALLTLTRRNSGKHRATPKADIRPFYANSATVNNDQKHRASDYESEGRRFESRRGRPVNSATRFWYDCIPASSVEVTPPLSTITEDFVPRARGGSLDRLRERGQQRRFPPQPLSLARRKDPRPSGIGLLYCPYFLNLERGRPIRPGT
jgi:hypothetical protein